MLSHVGSKLMWHPLHRLFLRLPMRSSTAARCIPTLQQQQQVHICPASHICTLMLQPLLQPWAPPPPLPTSSLLRAPHGTPHTLPIPARLSTRSRWALVRVCWLLQMFHLPNTNPSLLPSPILVLPEDLLFTLDIHWAQQRSTSTHTCSSQKAMGWGCWRRNVGEHLPGNGCLTFYFSCFPVFCFFFGLRVCCSKPALASSVLDWTACFVTRTLALPGLVSVTNSNSVLLTLTHSF